MLKRTTTTTTPTNAMPRTITRHGITLYLTFNAKGQPVYVSVPGDDDEPNWDGWVAADEQ